MDTSRIKFSPDGVFGEEEEGEEEKKTDGEKEDESSEDHSEDATEHVG